MDSAWRDDLFTFAPHRTVDVAYGSGKKRKEIIEQGAEYVIINYDGVAIVKDEIANGGFDLIIVDRPDPIGPGNQLFKINFYKDLRNIISKKGTIVFQTGVPFFQKKELKETSKKLNSIFRYSGTYHTVVPTYIGGHMTLSWASKAKNLNKKINIREANIYLKKIITNYYTPEIHNSSLNLPLWIKKLTEFN